MDTSSSAPDPGSRRLVDAVGNRLEEALRTVEDQLRFRHGLAAAPRRWREVRHEVAELRRALAARGGPSAGPSSLARDVGSDPGHPDRAEGAPPTREDAASVLAANVARAREAARSLEEEIRIAAPDLAGTAERLRYRIYSLEAADTGFLHRRHRLHDARLYVLVTTALASGPIEEVTRAAIRGGADLVQFREKEMEGREFLALAERLRSITADEGAILIVNDRVEIAALVGADGVHLGQGDILPSAARRLLGPEAVIGLSTHSPEEAAAAAEQGADYIGVGPIHATRTKEHRRAVGLDAIAAARAATDLPGFAIGSVNRDTVDAVLAAGAERIAVCTGIIAQEDVEGAARDFRERLDQRVS